MTVYAVTDSARGGCKVRLGMYWYCQTRERAQIEAQKRNKPSDPNRYRVQTVAHDGNPPAMRDDGR